MAPILWLCLVLILVLLSSMTIVEYLKPNKIIEGNTTTNSSCSQAIYASYNSAEQELEQAMKDLLAANTTIKNNETNLAKLSNKLDEVKKNCAKRKSKKS